MSQLTSIKLSGLTCEACQKLITKRIMKISGVSSVTVEPNGDTQIESDRTIDFSEVKSILEGTQYKVSES